MNSVDFIAPLSVDYVVIKHKDFWVDMISSDYNGSYLPIVLLTKWYQSVVMIIIGQW